VRCTSSRRSEARDWLGFEDNLVAIDEVLLIDRAKLEEFGMWPFEPLKRIADERRCACKQEAWSTPSKKHSLLETLCMFRIRHPFGTFDKYRADLDANTLPPPNYKTDLYFEVVAF
jgi:hypothetical protein